MKIYEKLQRIGTIVTDDRDNGSPPGLIGKQLSNAAVEAITNGIKSEQWKTYMSLFADNAGQLERLTVPQPDEPTYLPLLRAYIVSNAVCDIGTTTNTINKIENDDIDAGLSPAPDEAVAALRPFDIPGLHS
jgi:hypothetical protein